MKLGILQLHITADIADNKTRLAEGIIDLAHRGAELIVLQELHNTLYFCQVEDVENFNLAEPIPGPSTDFYGKLAKDLGVVIVTSTTCRERYNYGKDCQSINKFFHTIRFKC